MSIQGNGRLLELFEELCDHATDEQERRAAELELIEPELAAELRRLLAIDATCDESISFTAAPPLDLQVGSRIDQFLLLEVLGEGGMGVVFRARDVNSGHEFALKVLRTNLPRDEDRARLEREAALLRRIDHPGVCRIHGTGHLAGRFTFSPYLVMDLVEGRDLMSYARDEGLDLNARLILFEGLCEAVVVAHGCGVLHRDLTPKNVLVRRDGTPVVIDFGLAYSIGAQDLYRLTRTGRGVGTSGYMSPEQEAGEPLDARADVYALGVLLHELLTGNRPTRSKSGRPLGRQFRLDRTLPRNLRLIIGAATARRARHRYAGVDALLTEVRCARDGGRVEVALWRSLRFAVVAAAILTVIALQCWSWSRGATRLDRAWASGDLLELQAGLGSLPGVLDALLLPRPVQSSVRELRTGDEAATVIQVILAGRERGRSAEVMLACRFVDRDGYDAHPLLLSSIERALRRADESERERMMIAVSCMFDCREADDPDETAAVARLRDLFEYWATETPDRSLGALSCLGGCGDAGTFAALDTVLGREDLHPETVRLCGRAAQLILARAERCGYARALGDPALSSVRAGFKRHYDRHVAGPHAGVLSSALLAFGQAADLFLLRNELPIPSDGRLTAVRAQYEPESGRRMMESMINQLRAADRAFPLQARILERLGLIAGFNGANADDPLIGRALIVAQDVGLEANVARFHIDTGRTRARNHQHGRYPELRPTDEERLSFGLLPPGQHTALAGLRSAPGTASTLAEWDFRQPEVALVAAAAGVWTRDAPLRGSDLDPGRRYVDLTSAGRSEVRCTFRIDDEQTVHASLRLEVVRARRVLLPHEGRALVDVALDGVFLGTSAVELAEPHWITYQLQAERLTLGDHQLVITLPEGATTAVRLQRVVVRNE